MRPNWRGLHAAWKRMAEQQNGAQPQTSFHSQSWCFWQFAGVYLVRTLQQSIVACGCSSDFDCQVACDCSYLDDTMSGWVIENNTFRCAVQPSHCRTTDVWMLLRYPLAALLNFQAYIVSVRRCAGAGTLISGS